VVKKESKLTIFSFQGLKMKVLPSTKMKIVAVGCLSYAVFGCFPNWDLDNKEPGLPEDDAGRDNSEKDIITIASYNVEDFDLGQESEGQYDHIAAFAADNAVDILVFVETQKDANGDDELLFSAALEDALYSMPYRGFSSMSDGFNASAVWSRFPLSDLEEILLENTRSVFRFTARISGEEAVFLACHLKSGDDTESAGTRQNEARRIESYIVDNLDPRSKNIVILGDMNTMSDSDFITPGTLSFLSLKSNNPQHSADDFIPVNLTLLPNTPTYPSYGNILDHILLSPSLWAHYVEGSVTVPAPAGDGPFGPSDHYPVMLDLSM
jgi:endonuclease/exonuclease/phosphatase family metal-dependent hydrolase